MTLLLAMAGGGVTPISASAVLAGRRHPMASQPFRIGWNRALQHWKNPPGGSVSLPGTPQDFRSSSSSTGVVDVRTRHVRGGKQAVRKPPALLKWAYAACGVAVTATWSTIVYTTIRSNQPVGMVMPSVQHGLFARFGALSAVPLMVASYTTLTQASSSWEELSSPTCRRQNLAWVTAGVGGALWVAFAPLITKIPGTEPLLSHQSYKGPLRAALMGAYASAAALSAAVWQRTALDPETRQKPWKWPQQVADGVTQSLVSLAPANVDNPVNVKYSLLATGFLFFTGFQLVGQHPATVIPSWTARRLARAFPAWTLLAAVTALDLKQATERGTLRTSSSAQTMSRGLRGFGATYLTARLCCLTLDPSFPGAYHGVIMVPGWAALAILMMGLTQRSDEP